MPVPGGTAPDGRAERPTMSSSTPFARALSRLVGWLADRKVPTPLRGPVYGTYARLTGADPGEAQLPLAGYPSLGAFFVRRLRDGARPLEEDPRALLAPCDGVLQALDRIEPDGPGRGTLLQAKGRRYAVEELLASAAGAAELAAGFAWTIYLGPRDYHRVHAPFECTLSEVRWVPGTRYSVNPRVLARRDGVLAGNERAVLRLETPSGAWFLVMVGALNVGRIRVLGVDRDRSPARPLAFARGEELARFEMGSTVVLVAPPGAAVPQADLYPGRGLRLGRQIGTLTSPP